MERYAFLVVGGGPAGLAAARAYRNAGGDGRVAIASDEQRMPYERPPLTKELLRGEMSEEELPIEEEGWLEQQRVDLIGGRIVALEPGDRIAYLSGGPRFRTSNACWLRAPSRQGLRSRAATTHEFACSGLLTIYAS